MTIRNFTQQDQERYLAFSRDFYSGGAVLHTVPDENFEKTFALCLAGSPLVRGVMLEENGELAGYALLAFAYSNEAGGLAVWLEELYILPEARGSGLGNQFFDWMLEEYQDAARIRLEVNPENERAIQLYHKRDFQLLNYVQMVKES